MHQRRQVHEFDHRGDPHELRQDASIALPTAQEDQRRPDPLTRGINTVVSHVPDLRLKGRDLRTQEDIQLGHVRPQAREHRREVSRRRTIGGNRGCHRHPRPYAGREKWLINCQPKRP